MSHQKTNVTQQKMNTNNNNVNTVIVIKSDHNVV